MIARSFVGAAHVLDLEASRAAMLASTTRGVSRSLFPAPLLATAAISAHVLDGVEVGLFDYSISQAGALANYGYSANSPDLVTNDDAELPLGLHDGHDDAGFTRDRLYTNAERVNANRFFGVRAIESAAPPGRRRVRERHHRRPGRLRRSSTPA